MLLPSQEAFDKIVQHLLTQNQRCSSLLVCKYRNEEGLRCAIGCMLEDYVPSLEGKPIAMLILLERIPDILDRRVYQALQKIHDCVDVALWKSALEELASTQNLIWRFSCANPVNSI